MARLTGWLLTTLTAATLLVLPVASTSAHGPANGQAVSQAARARGEQLTMDLVELNAQYQLAASGQKPQLEQSLLAAARTREQEMLSQMESDPAGALRVAIPASLRAGLPASVRQHVEEETTIEGTLEVLHEDSAAGGRYHYHLDTANGRLTLYFAGDAPDDVLTGSRVRAHGVRLSQTLALDGSGSIQPVTTALANTFGAQKTLVILVNFTDNATQPYTIDYANSVVFTTTSNFDLENSYGKTSLVGDVVGWYTIPMSSTVCDYNTLATYAKNAATAAGVNVNNYTRHVFAFPQNACTWWGLGTVGGNPSKAWINGSFQLRVVGHEMGHNFGLYHSHYLDCGTTVLATSCTTSEYGDTLDIMGSSSGHFNAYQKERMGWLNYGTSPPLYTVSTSGTYTIEPYETQTSNPKGVKVVRSVNPSTGKKTWYYFEYRQGIGYDGFVSTNTNVKSGVVVHLGTEGSGDSSYLLDMTPATSSWSDPAIVVGQSYVDPDAGITITPVWADATGAGLSVAFGPMTCVRGTPTVSLTPTQSQWLPSGAMATFTATVTNNDNAGCAVTTFSLQNTVPSGWTGSLGTSSVALSPGGTTSTPLNVTSPSSAANGFYEVAMNASDGAVSTHTGSASATYVVMSALSVSVSTNQVSYNRPSNVTITTTVSANGAPVAGAAVTVSVTRANGSVATSTATTDASGRAVTKVSLKPKDPVGTYQVVSNASMNGGASGQATTSFSVK